MMKEAKSTAVAAEMVKAEKGLFEKTVDKVGQEMASQQGPPEQADGGIDYEEIILDLAHKYATFFHNPDNDAYASITMGGKRLNLMVQSKNFKNWLNMIFYRHMGKPAMSSLLKRTISQLEAEGMYDGAELSIHVRSAKHEEAIYIDLCNSRLDQVRIDKEGWKVISSIDSPVRFIQPRGMLALPVPTQNGSIKDLRPFLNIDNDDDFTLIVSWILKAMTPSGPYPVMIIQGEQGSSKTTTAKVLRSLTDPSSVPSQAFSRSDRDLMITAGNSWVLSFDNVSLIKDLMSDSLCRISVGGGIRIRRLRTDNSEELFSFSRPIIINSIDEIVDRHDLSDRALFVNLQTMPDTARKAEDEFWREFEAVRSQILGAFYDAISIGLRNYDNVSFDKLPRMADFAKFVVASEPALPWESEMFMAAYDENRNQVIESALEADIVAWVVMQFMSKRDTPWSGTPTKLKNVLDEYAAQCGWKKADWPKAPNGLSNRLRRANGFLTKKNILVERSRSGNRMISISKLGQHAGLLEANMAHVKETAASEAEIFDRQFSIEDNDNVEYGEGEI